MGETINYRLLKQCQNCGTLNGKKANKCRECKLLFVKEVE